MRKVAISADQVREVRLCLEPELARQTARHAQAKTDAGATQTGQGPIVLRLFVEALRVLYPDEAIPSESADPALAYRAAYARIHDQGSTWLPP